MIGKSVPRVDAYEKVTGRAKFTDDLVPPRCLVAKVLHATIGNGIVKSIDTSEAVALEGVVKVVTFYDSFFLQNYIPPVTAIVIRHQGIRGLWNWHIRMWQTVIF